MEAAEESAAAIRAEAEARARERIEEADRAGELRVKAAEAEAEEMLRATHLQTEGLRNEALLGLDDRRPQRVRLFARSDGGRDGARHGHCTGDPDDDAGTGRRHADPGGTSRRGGRDRDGGARGSPAHPGLGGRRAGHAHGGGGSGGPENQEEAHTQAREIVADAYEAASEAVAEGEEMSTNLRDLGASLRTNAERLLRDVRLIDGSMVARLDRIEPGVTPPPASLAAGGTERGS